MKCLIFANCQGEAIGKILREHQEFSRQYEIKYICNFECIEKRSGLPMDEFAQADLLIFQPISAKHGEYCTDSIGDAIKSSCKSISFPYIYNSGAFAIFEEGNDIVGKEVIIRLMKEGLSRDDIIKMILAEAIDFNIRDRFSKSMEIMKAQESERCSVKISEFILKIMKYKRAFLTQNHVSNIVLLGLVNQMLCDVEMFPIPEYGGNEIMSMYPVSPFEAKALEFEYAAVDPEWFNFIKHCIERIYSCDFETKR